MPPIAPAVAIPAAAMVALSDPHIRGALIGTAAYGADRLTQKGIQKGLESKHRSVRKIANKAADIYESVDASPMAGIWKQALTGAASDRIGRKAEAYNRPAEASPPPPPPPRAHPPAGAQKKKSQAEKTKESFTLPKKKIMKEKATRPPTKRSLTLKRQNR